MDLKKFHDEIDACDRELIRLLNRRATAAVEIGRMKREAGKAAFVPDRESAVYKKVETLNTGPLNEQAIRSIYLEIMSACIALQAPTRIAYPGPPGSNTHQAALEKFGKSIEYFPMPEIRDVFQSVSRNHTHFGIVPIENSTNGAISETGDNLMETDLKICSEVYLETHYHLLSNSPLTSINLILGVPDMFAKCRQWLTANLQDIKTEAVTDAVKGVERASLEDGVAVIANESAITLFDISLVERCIEDRPDEITRFIVIGHTGAVASGDDLTSIKFFIHNKPGSLYHVLGSFFENNVSILRIENKPSSRSKWEHVFFIDLEGHSDDEKVSRTLATIREISDGFMVLGSYPRSDKVLGVRTQPNSPGS